MSHYAQLSSSFHAFMGLCSILLMTLAVCFMITSLLHGFSRKSQWIGGVLCCLCILFMQGLCDLGRDGSQKLFSNIFGTAYRFSALDRSSRTIEHFSVI